MMLLCSTSTRKGISLFNFLGLALVGSSTAQVSIPEGVTIIESSESDLYGNHAFAISADGSTIAGSADLIRPYYSGIYGYLFADIGSDSRYTDSQSQPGGIGLDLLDGRLDLFPNVVELYGSNTIKAFRWTNENGQIELPQLDSSLADQYAYALSSDGSVIVGDNGGEAFRWTQESGMVGLSFLPNNVQDSISTATPIKIFIGEPHSSAMAVSADGSVVIGTSNYVLFKWTQESGIVGLLDPVGDYYSGTPNAVSADGSVVVGRTPNFLNGEAFRWSENEGLTKLGDLPGGAFASSANDVSADGSVIVGIGTSTNGYEAFRWTQEKGMIGLGDLDGGDFESYGRSTSANGSVVVGQSKSANGTEAFRWTETDGMHTINEWLAESDITTDLLFTTASDISDDGAVVIGTADLGNGDETFVARGSAGAISINDFTQSFGTTASIQQTALALPSIVMNGAHHRVLMEQNFADANNMVWANGDFANHSRRDADITTGEVGMAHDFNSNIRAGFGAGYGTLDQDLSFNGKQELDGQYIIAEVDYRIPKTSIILSLTGSYGDWDTDISRGYENAGTPDNSQGETDVETLSVRLRADWVDAFQLGEFSFSPRISFTTTKIDTDGYTETGGGFPAMFDAMSHTSHEVRIGLTGEAQINDKTTVRGILEGVHQFDEDGDDFSGEVIGLFPFAIPSNETDQTWARVGGEISHWYGDNLIITGTLFGATQGEDPSVSVGLNLSCLF